MTSEAVLRSHSPRQLTLIDESPWCTTEFFVRSGETDDRTYRFEYRKTAGPSV